MTPRTRGAVEKGLLKQSMPSNVSPRCYRRQNCAAQVQTYRSLFLRSLGTLTVCTGGDTHRQACVTFLLILLHTGTAVGSFSATRTSQARLQLPAQHLPVRDHLCRLLEQVWQTGVRCFITQAGRQWAGFIYFCGTGFGRLFIVYGQ